jgi:tetrahydromethanopterin S-methyltransferase subunit F
MPAQARFQQPDLKRRVNTRIEGGEVNRGIIGAIIGVLVIIILVIVILQLT